MFKRISSIILAVIICSGLFAFAGCSSNPNQEDASKIVVAEVNGKAIYKSAVDAEFVSYQALYSMSGAIDENEFKDEIRKSKENTLDALIKSEIIKQKAEELKIFLSNEELSEIDSDVEKQKDALLDTAEQEVAKQIENKTITEDNKQATLDAYNEQLLLGMGIENGIYKERLINERLKARLIETQLKEAAITDEDAKAYYDATLTQQKTAIEANPDAVKNYSDELLFFDPSGHRKVKQILIAFPESIKSQITNANLSGDTATITKLKGAELPKIQDTAIEIYNKAITSGANFDALIAQYGQDESMKAEPYKTEGVEVYKGMSGYDSDFINAAMALENVGEISAPISSMYGYHIIKYISDVKNGTVPFEDVKDKIVEKLLSEKQTAALDELLAKWQDEADIKKYADKLV